MKFLNYNYNSDEHVIEITASLDNGDIDIVQIPDSVIIEMTSIVPALAEEKMAQDLLKKMYSMKEEQRLTVEYICQKIEEYEKLHEEIRDELSVPNLTKEEISALTAKSNDLSKVKTLLDTKRHTVKLIDLQIAALSTKIAKIQAGFA